jgi:hypothetical protein
VGIVVDNSLTASDWFQLTSTALAAAAAVVSAVSAWLSSRSTRAAEEEARVNKSLAAYELVRNFERDYAQQYETVMEALGPWPDQVDVDPLQRKVVNELLQNLSSAYLAAEMGLLTEQMRDYIVSLFIDWLQVDEGRRIWVEVFRVQPDTYPPGFIEFLDARLATMPTFERPNRTRHPND